MESPHLTIVNAPANALEIINKAYRICYSSEEKEKPGTREDFVAGFVKIGHLSPTEHASITFEVTNISRACSTQILRHRLASYNERSLRYVDASKFEFIVPVSIEHNQIALKMFNTAVRKARDTYKKLLDMGMKKEDARACLPLATCTRLMFTYNFREIHHFLSERLSPRAQREIRLVACQMYTYMEDLYPWMVKDLAPRYAEAIKRNKEEEGGK